MNNTFLSRRTGMVSPQSTDLLVSPDLPRSPATARRGRTNDDFFVLVAFPTKINPVDLLYTRFPLGFVPPLELGGITGDVIV
jgi:hypothetical protein